MIDKRVPLTTTLLVTGILILGFGIRIGLDLSQDKTYITYALFIGLSLITVGWAILEKKRAFEIVETKVRRIADWFGVKDWQVLLLFVSFAFAFLAIAGSGFEKRLYSPTPAIIAWILGILLAFLGGYPIQEELPKISRQTFLSLAIITSIAFLFRGLGITTIPVVFTGDEALAGLNAAQFRSGDWNNIFVTSWHSFPSFFSSIQSIFLAFFGQTAAALRLLSALVGALTVAAVYLCGRAMFGHRAGIWAALTLSAIHFHIHFSRLGLNNIWDGLWYTLAVGSLWYGWEHSRRIGYLIAGLALGFSQYFYVSSRGLFVILIVGMLFAFLFQRARFYRAIPDLVLTFMIAMAVTLPLLWFYAHRPGQFLAPLERVSFLRVGFNGPVRPIDADLWEFALKQILTSAQIYTHVSVQYWYTPDAPMLRPIFATLFYLGLIFLCLKNRDSRFLVLALWLLLFIFIGGLSESSLAAQRYVAAVPACALVVGYGLHKTTDFFENLWQRHAKVIVGLSTIVIGSAMISDLYFYYIEYQSIDRIEDVASHGIIAQQLANRLEDEPEGTQVAFFGVPELGYYSIPSIQYLAPQVKGIDVAVPWKSFDKTVLSSKHIIFVFLPERKKEIGIIKAEYPNGVLDEEKAWNNQVLFWVYDYAVK